MQRNVLNEGDEVEAKIISVDRRTASSICPSSQRDIDDEKQAMKDVEGQAG